MIWYIDAVGEYCNYGGHIIVKDKYPNQPKYMVYSVDLDKNEVRPEIPAASIEIAKSLIDWRNKLHKFSDKIREDG